MYLDNVLTNNEKMLDFIIDLHQKGEIPVNSWVINLDQIAENAKQLSAAANKNGLSIYLMSKQHNRNPYINALAIKMGLNKMVAVDFQGALACREFNIPLGHVGHLNQIPKHLTSEVIKLKPDVFTVYNYEHALWIDQACKELNCKQDIMIRVYNDDYVFEGQEGGFHISEIDSFIDQIKELKNIELVGVTAFPCLKYNESKDEKIIPTKNVEAINRAIQILKGRGIEIKQVNMPGNTSSLEMPLLKELGATHVEPGNALLGTSPCHAFSQDLAESTAIAYLSEISHKYDDRAYAYGGGCYHTNYSDKMYAFIGSKWSEAKRQGKVFYRHEIVQDIDYHAQFIPTKEQKVNIGDSVVGVYRTQMHMTRSYQVAISGISGDRPLKVHYILSNGREPLDNRLNPVNYKDLLNDIDELLKLY
ncbi:MAG: alanine racemase [Spirochaetaceae bacterium]